MMKINNNKNKTSIECFQSYWETIFHSTSIAQVVHLEIFIDTRIVATYLRHMTRKLRMKRVGGYGWVQCHY